MEKEAARQIIIEHLEQSYQQTYTEVCLGGNFKLEFIPAEVAAQKWGRSDTWVAHFFLNLVEVETEDGGFMEFFPISISIYLDDETGEIWEPYDPNRKLSPKERRDARKARRQARRDQK